MKKIDLKIETPRSCPFRSADGTCYHPETKKKESYHKICLKTPDTYKSQAKFPNQCPLHDCFKCDRCHDTGKLDQGFADYDNVINCPECSTSKPKKRITNVA